MDDAAEWRAVDVDARHTSPIFVAELRGLAPADVQCGPTGRHIIRHEVHGEKMPDQSLKL